MPTSPVRSVIEHLRRAVTPEGDGELLGRFVERRDERALAALVDRHGPMVWGVCRRLLSHHDAEDAFQAAFIVLMRKAACIKPRKMVGNWLYGVAHQAALQARRTIARRRAREVQVTEMPDAAAAQNDQGPDVQPLLDQELSRLPDVYRVAIVLCDLEGKTRKDVALQLGCPEGTVASRLVRARSMLAKRLTQRGVALSGALALSQNVVSAAVPASLVTSTIKAATVCGQAAVSLKVAALTEGVLKTMLLTKLKSVMAILVVAAMVGAIGFGVAWGQEKGDAVAPQKLASEKAPKVEDAVVKEKAEAIAWGKEVDGLQMGLAAEAQTFRQGETVKLAVKLRNMGKAEVTVTYGVLREHPPQVTTDTGGRVSVYMPPPFDGLAGPTKRTLKPGETITLFNPEVAVESEARARLDGEMRVDTPTICVEPGKYKIAYSGIIQSHPKLATGIAEFEVKDQVAWGKEVDGLQAGLVAEAVACRPGDKLKFTVKLRNVSKAEVSVTYAMLRDCAAQTTTDTGGRVSVYMPPSFRGYPVPTKRTLEPGETITLYNPEVAVESEALMQLKGIMRVDTPTICVEPGKYKIAYSGMVQSHSTLSTDVVEFEVKAAKE